MGKVFFTSDLHFGHENAIRFDNRPFTTVEEMDAELVRRWNAKVGKGDLVYVLGDMIWKSGNGEAEQLIKSLNGQIILIKGNHDRFLHNAKAKNALAGVKDFDDICVTLEDGTKRRCILQHAFVPMYYGHRHQAIHLHGHSHQTEESVFEFMIQALLREQGLKPEIYNVGCMYWNYEPVTLDEILSNRHELMARDLHRYLAYLENFEIAKEKGVFEDIKTGLQQAIDGESFSENTLSTESEENDG